MTDTDKESARYNFEQFILKYKDNRNDILDINKHFNEDQARREYIDRFFEILGWDVRNDEGKDFATKDVVTEQYIDASNKPDYSLRRNGDIILTVEAEKPSKNLLIDRQPAHQVLRYGWFAANDIGVLYNVEMLEIYQTFKEPDAFDEKGKNLVSAPYRRFRYDDMLNHFDEIWEWLSRESVYGNTFDSKVANITPDGAQKTRLNSIFLNELDEWRLLIGQDLIENETSYISDTKKLNDDVQTFLNQVIFLRFAEDNSLEQTKVVEQTFDDSTTLDNHLQMLDRKYNSGIFTNNNIAKLLRSKTVKKITDRLYYPQVSYDFKLIDVTILGEIYEQFLQRELVIIENTVQLVETRAASIKAVVSTPPELTKKITQIGLAAIVNDNMTIDDILALKIADIAVGSGVFLVAAYDYLEGRIIDILAQQQHVLARQNLITFPIKKRLIYSVFRGADIDHHAVEITKFSLALRLLRNESSSRTSGLHPLIPSLSDNILNENSLVNSIDIDEIIQSGNTDLINRLDEQINMIAPSDNNVENTFDLVLGNPPYLDTEGMKSMSNVEFDIYSKKYESSYKQYDKSYLFIEEAVSRINETGHIVLLVPNKFAKIEAGSKLRKLLSEHNLIQSVIDFGEVQLFKGKSTYVSIITLSHNNTIVNYKKVASISEIDSIEEQTIDYSDLSLNNGPWIMGGNVDALRLFKALKEFPRISEKCEIANGIQTSSKHFFISLKSINSDVNGIIKFTDKFGKHQVERSIVRPFFKNVNHDAKKYSSLENDQYVIFPYEDGKVIPSSSLRSKYPKAYNYFRRIKPKILPKSYGGKRDVPNAQEIYQYGRTQALNTDWNREKIVVTVLSKYPSVAYDNSGSLIASGGTAGYVPIFEKDNGYSLKYILAWLNLEITDNMFRLISNVFEGGYWAHGTNYLNQVPILTVDFEKTEQQDIYNEIIELVDHRIATDNTVLSNSLELQINNKFKKLIELQTGLII